MICYGVYKGSYDGGGTDTTLFINPNIAREKCLKLVSDVDKETGRMLRFSLKGIKEKSLIDEYKKRYKPMEETSTNHWSNGMDTVCVVQFEVIP